MKNKGYRRWPVYLLVTAAVLLAFISVTVLMRTFNQYYELSLQRQDSQLEKIAQAADVTMANHLRSFREELRYVITRRGFMEAERSWYEESETDDLLGRMQENLISSNPLIHNMVVVRDGEIALIAESGENYTFTRGMAGELKPCFTDDGTMYLALFEDGQYVRFAVLISMNDWYKVLADTYASDSIHLMLLGMHQRVLLHTWMDGQYAQLVDELTNDNCDMQAVEYMVQSGANSQRLMASYHLTYPGDDYTHEMRMTAIPLTECTNGYFSVGMTSDYDEIILPMQSAAWWMFTSGAMLVTSVLLMIFMAIMLVHRGRQRDRELESLVQRNEETQKLLEKTTELAHHQRLETIGTLTASIAHEFNNLLTPIMGYSILTLEGLPEDCDDLADNITEIYEASRKAKDIISRLNALSRKSAETAFTPLSLHGIVEKAMRVAATAQPAWVKTQLTAEEGELIVSGIETQLSQLLLNLILNAYHAMEKDGGTLTLTLRRAGEQAVLLVQDEGVGIPEDALPVVFEPFFTTKETGSGTGLGLAIVQQITQSHHGTITVESTLGQGTTFTLQLPLAETESTDNP